MLQLVLHTSLIVISIQSDQTVFSFNILRDISISIWRNKHTNGLDIYKHLTYFIHFIYTTNINTDQTDRFLITNKNLYLFFFGFYIEYFFYIEFFINFLSELFHFPDVSSSFRIVFNVHIF